jgi:hypothetical protein
VGNVLGQSAPTFWLSGSTSQYVNLAKPRPRSVAGCDVPCRRSTEGRNQESALGAISGNNADQNVGGLHGKVERKFVEVMNSASTEGASKSKGVSNSKCDDLHGDTSAHELRMNSNSDGLAPQGVKLRKTMMYYYHYGGGHRSTIKDGS